MQMIKLVISVFPALLMTAQTPASKSAEAGWVMLFDGKSLNGWHLEGDAEWRVENGAISARQTGDGWLRSAKTYSDFKLRLEFRNSPKGNSGVFIRAGKDTKPAERCNPQDAYEVQINNEEPEWATGSVEDKIQRSVKVNPPADRWHRYEIEARGDHIVIHLDGRKVLDGRNADLKSGYLGLQHHKDSPIQFRKLAIKEFAAKGSGS